MKKFLKKKIYFLAVLISFSTLFSAILYAQGSECITDGDCPEGYICQQPEGICIPAAIITCNQHNELNVLLRCWTYNPFFDPRYPLTYCEWSGSPLDECMVEWPGSL
jgi:hypothetical protein